LTTTDQENRTMYSPDQFKDMLAFQTFNAMFAQQMASDLQGQLQRMAQQAEKDKKALAAAAEDAAELRRRLEVANAVNHLASPASTEPDEAA
jgi:hypothetical protein